VPGYPYRRGRDNEVRPRCRACSLRRIDRGRGFAALRPHPANPRAAFVPAPVGDEHTIYQQTATASPTARCVGYFGNAGCQFRRCTGWSRSRARSACGSRQSSRKNARSAAAERAGAANRSCSVAARTRMLGCSVPSILAGTASWRPSSLTEPGDLSRRRPCFQFGRRCALFLTVHLQAVESRRSTTSSNVFGF